MHTHIVEDIPSDLILSLESRKIRTLYYFILVCIHFYMNKWLLGILPEALFYFHVCFLTCISFYFNLAYYISMLCLQLTRNYKLMHTKFFKGYFKFIYSISFLVFLYYWLIIITNPSLIMANPFRLPLVLDLFLHGANYIINLAEHVYVCPKEDSDELGYIPYILFALFYSFLLQGLYTFYGVKIYPFVEKLNLIGYIGLNLLALFIVLFGDFTYYKLMKMKQWNKIHKTDRKVHTE